MTYRGLSFGAGSSAAFTHQQQPITRAYNSHSSHPVKYKNQYISHDAQQQQKQLQHQKQQQQIVTTAMIATAPPTVNPDRRSSLISSSTTSSSVTTIRQISGRTDWAAKYLQNASTKYSK